MFCFGVLPFLSDDLCCTRGRCSTAKWNTTGWGGSLPSSVRQRVPVSELSHSQRQCENSVRQPHAEGGRGGFIRRSYVGRRRGEFPESSVGEWTIVSPEDALYNLRIDYYPLTGRLTDIELALEIDGESPFDEAEKLNVSRAWKLDGDIERDNNDNDIRPGTGGGSRMDE